MDIVVKIAVGAITGVVQYLASPFMHHVSYLVHYKGNANELRNQMSRINELKVDVQHSMDAARMRGEVIKMVVQSWLTKVNQMQSEELTLQNALEESKGCLQGGCFGRYQVGKDAKHMIDDVNELLNEGRNFVVVSDASLLHPSLDSMQTLDFHVYGSTKSAMDQIMEALKDENINLVGVYGIGGVGKTTLMKEMAKSLRKDGLFDQVVMATVSQDPIFKNVQGEIAENLGMSLTEDFQSVRARRLLARLKQEKRILIVLDDLWKPLNLIDEVGIPYGNNCKVVLTTRQREVCNQMKTQSEVEVKVLSEGDAGVLFKWAAGDYTVDYDMLHLMAKQIVRKCGGLPIAIVTIGRALRSKDRFVWEDAASQLKKSSSPPDIEGVYEEVFNSIKLSYDFLASDATKCCFLLSCMFPENYIISEDDLLPYVVGEGVFRDVDTLMEARNRLHMHMERLKASCLLLDDSDEWKGCGVRMHDVIRDVSIWIASKEGHDFVVKSGRGLTRWPNKENLWKCKRLSLMQNKITKLPNMFDCSQLMTLSLRENWDLTEIPDGFFQGMKSLKTLDLAKTHIFSIPSSLSCLTDLRVLLIDGYCGSRPFDILLLGKLKKLEILHLQDSNVQILPEEIGRLTNLKSLNLSHNRLLTIAPNTLSRLSLLEELNLKGSFHKWQIEGSKNNRKACLSEVSSLSTLSKLNMSVSNIKHLHTKISFSWENLTHFSLSFGNDLFCAHPSVSACTSRVFISGSIPPLSNGVNFLLERSKGLEVNMCRGLKYVLSLGVRGLNNLQILHVVDCGDIEYLLSTVEAEDEVPQIAFSSLEELYMWSLPKLKAICHGSLPSGCFNNLRILYLRDCDSLISIIPCELMAKLQNLVELQVRYCSGPTELFNSKGLDEGLATMTKLKRLELRELTFLRTIWEGIVSPLSFLNLEELYVEDLGLNFLFSLAMAQRHQQLKQLEIQRCQKMVQIISMERDENTQRSSLRLLNSTNNPRSLLPITPIFGNLRLLRIWGCNRLKHILPMSLAQGLLQLEEFLISGCSNLEEIIVNDDIEKEAMHRTLFPQLRDLELLSLPNLSMTKEVLRHKWPSLETLKVVECPNLKRLPANPQTAKNLRKIVVKEEWFNALEWDDQNHRLHLQERGKMQQWIRMLNWNNPPGDVYTMIKDLQMITKEQG